MKNRVARKKKVRIQRIIRNTITAGLMVIAFGSGFLGHTVLKAHAEVKPDSPLKAYYTSVQIKPNDSLWDIAEQYSANSNFTVRQYVNELKRMNNLSSESIHAGEYITVVYYAE